MTQIIDFLNIPAWKTSDIIGLSVLILLCLILIWIYSSLYSRKMFQFSKGKNGIGKSKDIGISVIIAAKNEAENLTAFLPSILNQNAENFEVIVVNDGSVDGTEKILENFEKEYAHLKVCRTFDEEFTSHFSGKKLALTIGIKAARFEHLLFTDADCKPVSDNWISEVKTVIDRNDLTLLMGVYSKRKGLINALIRFETLKIAFNYGGFARFNEPYMSVGRNFAYKKSTFFDVKGYSKHLYVPSGDDDLFLQECVKQKKSVGVHFTKESKTSSVPNTSLKDWFYQKRRHISTASLYSKSLLFKLSFIECIQVLFFTLVPVGLLFINIPYALTYSIYGITVLIVLFRWFVLLKKIDEKIIVFLIPLYTVLVFLFQLSVSFSNMMNKPKNWMGK